MLLTRKRAIVLSSSEDESEGEDQILQLATDGLAHLVIDDPDIDDLENIEFLREEATHYKDTHYKDDKDTDYDSDNDFPELFGILEDDHQWWKNEQINKQTKQKQTNNHISINIIKNYSHY